MPKPLEEVFVEMPQEPFKKGLKRKREFMDNFFDEKKEIVLIDESSEEELFTEEEWKVTKFLDRHTDVSSESLSMYDLTLLFTVCRTVFAGQVADWRGNVGARTRNTQE